MNRVTVRGLRLDLTEGGMGLVSRRRWPGERRVRPFLIDGVDRRPVLLLIGLGFLVATACAVAAAVGLRSLGSALYFVSAALAVPVFVAAVAFLFASWAFTFPGRRLILFLEVEAAEEFKAPAEAELVALGPEPAHEDLEQAEQRLWALAQRLAVAGPAR